MKKFKAVLSALIVMVMIISLTACGSGSSSSSDTGSGTDSATDAGSDQGDSPTSTSTRADMDTLNVVVSSDATSLDPWDTIDVYSQLVYNNIIETLVELDENGELVPGLAESYEMIDDTTYEFKLKEGVLFHNGEEMKASDVVFTLRRGCESPMLNFLYGSVIEDSIEAVDDYTVRFSLDTPSSPFLYNMTNSCAGILSEKAVTEAGDTYSMNPVGTGPYKFVSWDKGTSIVLEAFEDYHGEPAKIKNVIIRPIPESTNRTIELESGGADIACDIPSTDIARVEENSDLQMTYTLSYSTTFLGFNCEAEPFDDVKVRQAVCYAIDYEGITQSVMQGYATPATIPVSSVLLFYDETAEHLPYDPEKAKELLAEAGYPDGFDMVIKCDERKERNDIATIIQSELAEVGINVTIESSEWATFINDVYAGNMQSFVVGYTASSPDPDGVVYSVFHSSMIGNNNNNFARFSDPETDEYLELGRTSFDTDERAEAYSKLYHRLNEMVPWDALWVDSKYVGLAGDVQGFVIDPMGVYDFSTVSFG